MNLFQLPNWPLLFICVGMIVCAVVDWWIFKVPNKLTFPLILSGWLLGLLHNFNVYPDGSGGEWVGGGIGAAIAGAFWGFALLYPVYVVGGVGAGDVKMTMAFGSWLGAFYGWEKGFFGIIFISFAAGLIIGGVIAIPMIIIRGEYRKNVEHTRVILTELATLGSIGQISQRAQERRPRWHKLPYGIPLCIGFVGVLFYLAQPQSEPVSPDQPQEQTTSGTQR